MLKYNIKWMLAVAVVAFAFTACEDPETTFDPINPDLTEEAILGTPQSANRTLNGLERQLVELMGEYVHLTEIASDNYDNTQTFFNQFLDVLDINSTDDDIDDTQFELARFRQLALSGLNIIGPADPGYTVDQEAGFQFFLGMSYLLAGELFTTLPGEPGGVALPAEEHLKLAESAFSAGLAKATDATIKTSCNLALARTRYRIGDKDGAVTAANAAIAADPMFIRFAVTDNLNGEGRTNNEMQDAIHDRGTFDDLQPLPRLDFLDPKYNDINASKDMDYPVLKIEEAHLIKCEAAIADGALGDAQSIMKDIIALVATRPTSTFDDSIEGRTEDDPGTRPNNSSVTVAASPGAVMRPGLVIDRDAVVTVSIVSATSVTDAMVDAVTNEDEALALLYLMRQEIFIAEGRRMTDMGVRFVVSQTEQLANANIKVEDTEPNIPPFIDAIKEELDAISYNAEDGICTIMHDINAIIVANKTSDFVCPFH